jgi:hypothetical protein
MSSAIVELREPHTVVEVVLILTALGALLLGTAVYFLDRDLADSMLLAPFVLYQGSRFAVFGTIGGFFPALMHAYAIPVLIIVTLRPWAWTRPWVCLLWFTMAAILEWLQSDAASALFFVADRLPGDMPLLEYLKNYAVQGQFDYIDLLATGVGCLTALAVTTAIATKRQRGLA